MVGTPGDTGSDVDYKEILRGGSVYDDAVDVRRRKALLHSRAFSSKTAQKDLVDSKCTSEELRAIILQVCGVRFLWSSPVMASPYLWDASFWPSGRRRRKRTTRGGTISLDCACAPRKSGHSVQ